MPRNISKTNTYTDKLLKLIPAEWVSAYIAIKGILDSAQADHTKYYGTFAVLLILLPFYLWRVLGVQSVWQIIITSVSFAVWVFSLGGDYVGAMSWYEPYLGSVLLVVWTLAIPIFIGKHGSGPGGR